ncbi:hypothetical protein GCM10027033_18710 [Leucobacter ruminantium]
MTSGANNAHFKPQMQDAWKLRGEADDVAAGGGLTELPWWASVVLTAGAGRVFGMGVGCT